MTRFFVGLLLSKALTIGLLTTLFFATSCRSEYTTQHFSFPPGSKPHEDDWQYTAVVIVTSNWGKVTRKSKKMVKIKIYDKGKTNYLSEELELLCASVGASVVWDRFEEFHVELVEEGNEFTDDTYNRELLKSGPRKMVNLTYRYNQEERRFKRVP